MYNTYYRIIQPVLSAPPPLGVPTAASEISEAVKSVAQMARKTIAVLTERLKRPHTVILRTDRMARCLDLRKMAFDASYPTFVPEEPELRA